ncbi:uncharacterized protein TRIADDRAFT_58545 [Trichoplax adhaerens]|uniref:SAC domain-containing protein n=1 Tax=Trichoplax adhaerens TaxID=10228 RepID=B3S300_TRIAD|nr:hypothetical protein TRIADDRAFT_58545 [Trichoplax adhaerens]EDV22880.1 hypothetical protein TRIADDRAFT_58545 [Trichoplax adhaerens]|eukprot:XP_002114746.1 hypothetical protein TRIADDRAFT_58545 [Trichoplax adhaerens]
MLILWEFRPEEDCSWYLLVICGKTVVGKLPGGHLIYRIDRVAALPLSRNNPAQDLQVKYRPSNNRTNRPSDPHKKQIAFSQAWNSLKYGSALPDKTQRKSLKIKEKLERRLLEELCKMFNDSGAFYYSTTGDITNSMQNLHSPDYDATLPLWKRVNRRFFWNKFMLKDLIDSKDPEADIWITPIMQGFIQIERFNLSPDHDHSTTTTAAMHEKITTYNQNVLSFVITRGSVPLFWSQPGIQYRPPPVIDKGQEDTQAALTKHFSELVSIYGDLIIISLIDHIGREKIIHDAFMKNIISYDSSNLTFVSFDFHEHWITSDRSPICQQTCVMRVNCMDCLDRTNVVQAAISRVILEAQLRKLGCLLPEQSLPGGCRLQWQGMWANCGDAISRQYAGTDALKGDYTRTGERNVKGVMKDGYNSANRYYLNRFRDTYRQTVIDIMLGNPVTEELQLLNLKRKIRQQLKNEDEWSAQREESEANVISHCQRLIVPEDEEHVAGWMLVNPHFCSNTGHDEDVALLLTTKAIYLASYDDENERITTFRSTLLDDVERIEIGMIASLFKSKFIFLRLHYIHANCTGYFYTLRNLHSKTIEDSTDRMIAIADAIVCTCGLVKKNPVAVIKKRLERIKSKDPNDAVDLSFMSRANAWFSKVIKPIKPNATVSNTTTTTATTNSSNSGPLSGRFISQWRKRFQLKKVSNPNHIATVETTAANSIPDIKLSVSSPTVIATEPNSTLDAYEFTNNNSSDNECSEGSTGSDRDTLKSRNQIWQSHSKLRRLTSSTRSLSIDSKNEVYFLCDSSSRMDSLRDKYIDLRKIPSCPDLTMPIDSDDSEDEDSEGSANHDRKSHKIINKNRYSWTASINQDYSCVRLSKIRPGSNQLVANYHQPAIKINDSDNNLSDFEVIDNNAMEPESLSDLNDELDVNSTCTICGKYKKLTDIIRDDFIAVGFKCASCSESSRNTSDNDDISHEKDQDNNGKKKNVPADNENQKVSSNSDDDSNNNTYSGGVITAKNQGIMTSFSSESLSQFRDSFRNRFSNAFVSKKVRRKRLQEIELSQMQEKLKEINCKTKFILI